MGNTSNLHLSAPFFKKLYKHSFPYLLLRISEDALKPFYIINRYLSRVINHLFMVLRTRFYCSIFATSDNNPLQYVFITENEEEVVRYF